MFPADIADQVLNNTDIDIQKLEWGINMRKAGMMADPYVLPYAPHNQACQWTDQSLDNLPDASTADLTGWKTYTQAADGFALDIPAGWTAVESSATYLGSPAELHFLNLYSPDQTYRLALGFRLPDQAISITLPGIGGDLSNSQSSITFLDASVLVQDVVSQGNRIAVRYGQGNEILANDMLFTARLDFNDRSSTVASIPADIVDLANRVLESARSFSPVSLMPTTTPVPTSNLGFVPLHAQRGGGPSIGAESLALKGNTAYVGFGPRLLAIDISHPANPKLIAQSDILPGDISGVVLLASSPNDQLMVAAGQSLFILEMRGSDFLNLDSPIMLPGKVNAMAYDATSHILYLSGPLADTSGFVAAIDVNAPANLRLVDQVELPNYDWSTGLSLIPGKLLYVGATNEQGQPDVIGIGLGTGSPGKFSPPAKVIQPSDDLGQVYAMHVYGNRLYISSITWITAYDITNFSTPKEVWKMGQEEVGANINFDAYDFVRYEGIFALVGFNPEGGMVPLPINFGPPETIPGDAGTPTTSMMAVKDNLLLIARDGLEIYGLSDAQAIQPIGGYHPQLNVVAGMVAAENAIYTVDVYSINQGNPYLHVLNPGDLSTISETKIDATDNYALVHWFLSMALDGDRLYISGRTGFYIFDVSQPEKPVLLAVHPEIEPWWQGLAASTVNGRRLVFDFEQDQAAPGGFALKVYDMTDLSSITKIEVPSALTLYSPMRLVWAENTLFLMNEDDQGAYTLYLFKLQNNTLVLQNPSGVGASGSAFAVKGSQIVVTSPQGLDIYAITNSPDPQLVFQTALTAGLEVKTLAFRGDQVVAIACGSSCQLLSIDISDPTQPKITGVAAIPPYDNLVILPGSLQYAWMLMSGDWSGVEKLGGEYLMVGGG